MSKLKFTFTNILFWAGFIASILIFDNSSMLMGQTPEAASQAYRAIAIPDTIFYLLFAFATASYLFMIIYDTFVNKKRVNFALIGVSIALLTCGLIGIWMFDGMSFPTVAPDLVITELDKIKHSLSFGLFVLTIYAMIFGMVQGHPSIRRLKWLFLAIILLTLFFAVYSLVTEFPKYQAILFVDESSTLHNMFIQSVFLNPNIFAEYLLLGTCAAIGLNYFKKNALSYLTIIFFAIIQIFVCCLTTILITLVLVFLYFLLEIIFSFKKNPGLGIFKIAVMMVIYISIVLTFTLCQTYEVRGLSSFCRYLYKVLSEGNYDSFSNRTIIWETAIKIVTSNRIPLIFGFGFRNTDNILGGLLQWDGGYRIHAHNAYITILMDTGIVGLSVFVLFLGFYAYCLIRLLKKDARFAFLFAIIGLSYFALGVTSNITPFLPSAEGCLIAILYFAPVFSKYLHSIHKEAGDYIIENHHAPQLMEPRLIVRGVARFIIVVMCVIAPLFVFDQIYFDHTLLITLENAEMGCLIALLTIPYLCGLWSKKGQYRSFIPHLYLVGILMVVATGILSYYYFNELQNLPEWFKWMIPASIGGILLLAVIVYSIVLKGSFKLYLNTFAAIKTSIGSLFGVGLYMLGLYVFKFYMDVSSPITLVVISIFVIIIFYSFALITPFKDVVAITAYNNEFDCSFMKRDVVRDRLEGQL